MPTRILLVSDVRLYLDGIVQLLRDESRIEVVGVASNIPDALSTAARLSPEIAVVDLAMHDSLRTIERMVVEQEGVKVLALTASEVDREIIACAEAGAIGYITRDSSVVELVQCLEAANEGELHCSPKVAAALMCRVSSLAHSASNTLSQRPMTKRERRILGILYKPNKEIARELNIEIATVKNHVHNIFEKLGVHSRAEAVMYYRSSEDVS